MHRPNPSFLLALSLASLAVAASAPLVGCSSADGNIDGADDGGTGADSGAGKDTGTPTPGTDTGTPTPGTDTGTPAPGTDTGTAPPSDGGVVTPTVGGIFEKPEPWTKDVSGLAKDARSDAITGALVSLGGWGAGALKIDFSIPIFFADSSTPRQTITKPSGDSYCYGGPDCDAVPLSMPLPVGGNTEGSADYTCDVSSNDCHVLVVEKNEKKLYELYNSTKTSGGFEALGAFVWDLTKAYPESERGEQCTSADAAGFPIAALMPTADEVAAGEVKHAIRFILPNNRMKAKVYVHPAGHAGGPSATNANAPPYGVRFRLKASFDESPYNASEKVILKALKKYGMLLSDGGNIAFTFADDRTSKNKWATLGVSASSFTKIAVGDFEVVDLSAEIPLTYDCVRNP